MPFSSSEILNKGNLAFKRGNLKKAKHFYNLVLKKIPNQSDANHNLGALETSLNNHQLAKQFYQKALNNNPNKKQFWVSYLLNLIKLDQMEEAKLVLEKSKSFGFSENDINDFQKLIYSANTGNDLNLIIKLFKNGEYEKVEKLAINFLNNNPKDINYLKILAQTYHDTNNFDSALPIYNKIIKLNPKEIDVYNNVGLILSEKKDYKEAEKVYRKAYEINPENSKTYLNFLSILLEVNKPEEMIIECKKLIQSNPKDSDLFNNLGNAFKKLSKYEEAETAYLKGIEINPLSSKLYLNYGTLLDKLNRDDVAIKMLNKSIECDPLQVASYSNLGHVYRKFDLEQYAEASFKKAITIDPNFAPAYFNLGNLYYDHREFEKAVYNYDNALKLDNTIEYLFGATLFAHSRICDWTDRNDKIDEIVKKIYNKEKVITPFPLLSLIDDPQIQKLNTVINSKTFPKNFINKRSKTVNNNEKIKIGYFSPDFRSHPIGYSVSELFEVHNREKFEVHAFYFGQQTQDEEYFRIKKGVDKFHEVTNFNDEGIASLANNEKIDIAVDLCCYTSKNRTNIFAMSAAPIQVTLLYAGTMGTNYYDYIIADEVIIPETHKKYYCEDTLYLPSWQVNESKKIVSQKKFTKKDFGIPDENFVFCSFNAPYKITPEIFDLWSHILKRVEKSVLILISNNQTTIQNLKNEIKSRGIDPKRLIFVENMVSSEHLARFKLMDLSLDTFPCNGGVTSSDSLRMGVPVLTCIGNSFVSRVGASVLSALNLNELIAKTPSEYIEIAVEIAKNQNKYKQLKKKLKQNLKTSLLFDTKSYCYHLEEAYIRAIKNMKSSRKID